MRMDFSIDLKGIHRAQEGVVDKAKEVLWLSMNKMQELSKRYAPVDTGEMKRSINLFPRMKGATEYSLSAGVYYAIFVEYGTFRMIKAHGSHDPENPVTDWEAKRKRGARDLQRMPFMRPALLEVEKVWVRQYWADVLGKV